MAEQRLPAVNGDDGTWGDILNQFLSKEHYNSGVDNAANGGHQWITVKASDYTTPGTAVNAPLKFTSGPLLSSSQAGSIEYNDAGTNGNLYVTYTQASVATRLKIAAYNDASGATGDLHYRDANGNFVRLPATTNTYVLTLAGGVPTWAAPSGGVGSYNYGLANAISAGIINF